MHFAALASLALAAVAQANMVTLWTLDNQTRTVYFTANAGVAQDLPPVNCSNAENKTVEFPDGWVGNFYSVVHGEQNKPGMLAELIFDGWNGLTYFDVSAIVDPTDHANVKQMWPAESQDPMSGCEVFPCNNAYYLPDDVQTKATKESHLITTLGSGSVGINFAQQQQQ